jgi:hypothetical protein
MPRETIDYLRRHATRMQPAAEEARATHRIHNARTRKNSIERALDGRSTHTHFPAVFVTVFYKLSAE